MQESIPPDAAANPKSGLPIWINIIIGIAIVFAVAMVGLSFLVGNMKKDSKDPAQIRQVLNSIATVEDPLPEGFKYELQLDLLGTKIVALRHEPDKMHLILTSIPSSKNPTSLEESISEAATSGVNKSMPNSNKFHACKKGSEAVAGRTLTYAIGTTTNTSGQDVPSLFGVFTPGDGHHVIMLTASSNAPLQKPADPVQAFNMAAIEEFLHAIKKF